MSDFATLLRHNTTKRLPTTALEDQGLLIIEVTRPHSHSDTPQSVALLWTSDQPVAETSS